MKLMRERDRGRCGETHATERGRKKKKHGDGEEEGFSYRAEGIPSTREILLRDRTSVVQEKWRWKRGEVEKECDERLKDDFGDTKPTYSELVKGWEGITGVLMVVLMFIAFTLATHWFRRSLVKLPKPFDRITGFNAFWYSHHLFVLVYILLVVHGLMLYLVHEWYLRTVRKSRLLPFVRPPLVAEASRSSLPSQTWMYLAVPLLLYAGERILRAFRSGYYSVRVLKVSSSGTTIFHKFFFY